MFARTGNPDELQGSEAAKNDMQRGFGQMGHEYHREALPLAWKPIMCWQAGLLPKDGAIEKQRFVAVEGIIARHRSRRGTGAQHTVVASTLFLMFWREGRIDFRFDKTCAYNNFPDISL